MTELADEGNRGFCFPDSAAQGSMVLTADRHSWERPGRGFAVRWCPVPVPGAIRKLGGTWLTQQVVVRPPGGSSLNQGRLFLQLAELPRPAAHAILTSLSKAALAGPREAGTWVGHSGRRTQVTPAWSDLGGLRLAVRGQHWSCHPHALPSPLLSQPGWACQSQESRQGLSTGPARALPLWQTLSPQGLTYAFWMCHGCLQVTVRTGSGNAPEEASGWTGHPLPSAQSSLVGLTTCDSGAGVG